MSRRARTPGETLLRRRARFETAASRYLPAEDAPAPADAPAVPPIRSVAVDRLPAPASRPEPTLG